MDKWVDWNDFILPVLQEAQGKHDILRAAEHLLKNTRQMEGRSSSSSSAQLSYAMELFSSPPLLTGLHIAWKDYLSLYNPLSSILPSVPFVPSRRHARNYTAQSQAFPVVAPMIWNGLPENVVKASTFPCFRKVRNSKLFRKTFEAMCPLWHQSPF